MFFVYVLVSEKNGDLYIGQTDNLERRLKEHEAGRTRTTRANGPYHLVYSEQFGKREDAVKRERKLKSGSGREFLKAHIRAQGTRSSI